jgi:hypothetical protein
MPEGVDQWGPLLRVDIVITQHKLSRYVHTNDLNLGRDSAAKLLQPFSFMRCTLFTLASIRTGHSATLAGRTISLASGASPAAANLSATWRNCRALIAGTGFCPSAAPTSLPPATCQETEHSPRIPHLAPCFPPSLSHPAVPTSSSIPAPRTKTSAQDW